MKKVITRKAVCAVAAVLLLLSNLTALTATTPIIATPSTQAFIANGVTVPIQSYLIAHLNHARMRDIASAINFHIEWVAATSTVMIDTARPYTGESVTLNPIQNAEARPSSQNFNLNGSPIQITAYLIAGQNYVRVQDISAAINISVEWEPVTNSVLFDTGRNYDGTVKHRVLTVDDARDYMLTAEYADAVRTEFYRLLNEHRAANGVRELKVCVELQRYADIRADEQRIRFGHTRPDGSRAGSGWHNSGNTINSRFAENVIGCGALGPNPASTALGIFTIWRESQGHNRHMLYNFDPHIKMALGIVPKLEDNGFVTSGAIFATGY
jgi:uncharacterized protein YkwD